MMKVLRYLSLGLMALFLGISPTAGADRTVLGEYFTQPG